MFRMGEESPPMARCSYCENMTPVHELMTIEETKDLCEICRGFLYGMDADEEVEEKSGWKEYARLQDLRIEELEKQIGEIVKLSPVAAAYVEQREEELNQNWNIAMELGASLGIGDTEEERSMKLKTHRGEIVNLDHATHIGISPTEDADVNEICAKFACTDGDVLFRCSEGDIIEGHGDFALYNVIVYRGSPYQCEHFMRWLGEEFGVKEYVPTVEFDNRYNSGDKKLSERVMENVENRHATESHTERLARIAKEATERLSRERPGGETDDV